MERIVLFPNPTPASSKETWLVLHTHGDTTDRHRLAVSLDSDAAATAKRYARDALGFDVLWTPRSGTAPDVYLGTRAA